MAGCAFTRTTFIFPYSLLDAKTARKEASEEAALVAAVFYPERSEGLRRALFLFTIYEEALATNKDQTSP